MGRRSSRKGTLLIDVGGHLGKNGGAEIGSLKRFSDVKDLRLTIVC